MIRLRSLLFTNMGESDHSWTEVEHFRAEPPLSAATPDAELGLEAIYDEHFDFVWRSLRRLGVHPAALDDALQDVFLVVHRRIADFEGRSALKTWLFGIALHVAREYARRTRKHALLVEVDASLRDEHAADPLERASQSEARDLLYTLLAELDEEKRTVFILAEIEGMSAVEIASGLGLNANTVASRLRAARQKFEAAARRHRARDGFARTAK